MDKKKKQIPFSGEDEATKQVNWKETDWNTITNFDEWKEADLSQIDLRSFNWDLARQTDVPVEVLQTLMQRLLLNTTKRVDTEGFRFRFNGNEIMPARNIMSITGQKKNGKSQLINILASISLKKSPVHSFGDKEHGFGVIECVKPVDRILWIDTEQGELDMEYNCMRLFNLMGLNVNEYDERLPNALDYGLLLVPLRPFSTDSRKIITDIMIRLYDPDIVIIDGIRDLMRDINNNEEATDIANWALRIADERDLWTVLHQNPTGTGDKMRGAIGTEMANKCTTTFQVSKLDSNIFSVFVPEGGSRQYAGDKNLLFRYDSKIELKPVLCANIAKRCFELYKEQDGTITREMFYRGVKKTTRMDENGANDIITIGLAQGWLSDVSSEKTKKVNVIYYRLDEKRIWTYEEDL